MTKQRNLIAFVVYAMYLITGACCIVVGSSIPSLMEHFDKSLPAIALLVSAFAIGRVATVFLVGILTEKFGAKICLLCGVIFYLAFLTGIPLTTNYFTAIILSVLAGIGMSTQDTCCAVILRETFPNSYSSSLSAGQAFFSIGCFLPPLLMGFALRENLGFQPVYLVLSLIGFLMLLIIPFLKIHKGSYHTNTKEQIPHENFSMLWQKKKWNYFCLAIACFAYFGTSNTIQTYTSTFVGSFGIPERLSVSVLTLYNVGCMIGSFAFIPILKKIHETKILWINMMCTLICLIIAMVFKNIAVFSITYLIAGFFCGVLFSVLVSIAVSLNPMHAGISAAAIAFFGGISDILSPIITGAIILLSDVRSTFYYCISMCLICLIAAIAYRNKSLL